ncbi:MAG TPA: glycosyltransferase [Caulobacteraceae bacterium]|nr:glycosyltransferase [Caulobacteraceae bacterium]
MVSRRKIVLSTCGSSGDLNPFIAVALELRGRGYHPVIATQSEFGPRIEAEGLAFHPMRPGMADVEEELGLERQRIVRRSIDARTGLEFLVRRVAMPFLRRAYADMMAASADAGLVVTHTSAFGARLAAEKRGLPWVSAALAPFAFMSAYDPPALGIAPRLTEACFKSGATAAGTLLNIFRLATANWTAPVRQLRRELGLGRAPGNPLFEGQFSPYGTVALYSRIFGELQPDFPCRTTICGFTFYDRERGASETLDPDLARFLAEGAPPLVFTLGSAVVFDPGDFYRDSLQLALTLKRRAVFLVGEDAAQALPADLPPGMIAVRYAPHSLVFPHAEAIVHQGGVGTTAQALRAGAPQLIVPAAADQPDNAQRIKRLGVGRSMTRAEYDPLSGAHEVGLMLRRGAYRARAQEVARRIALEDGAGAAADIIESALHAAPAMRRAG